MRGRILAIGLATLGILAPAAADAPAETCTDGPCGVPECWDLTPRVRPDMPRVLRVNCWNLTAMKLLVQPEHGTISDVAVDWPGPRFTMHAEAGAPRWDSARFEFTGPNGAIEVDVPIEVVPVAENAAPVCWGDKVNKRSDGQAPVDVFAHPSCWDPDEDEFVMDGSGPGVHLDAPKSVPSGQGEANWNYRTATHSGTEVAQVFATDVLGARSADAPLEVTVGPDVDRLPTCQPQSASFDGSGVFPVLSRAGMVRRFGVLCSDPDGDPFTTVTSEPPARGAVAVAFGAPVTSSVWGYEAFGQAVYTPLSDTYEPDEFALTSVGLRGSADQRFRIIPRALPANSGGSCGYSPAEVAEGLAGALKLWCSDDDGDPLSTEILTPPEHGLASAPLVTPGDFGGDDITIPYVPEPGYTGYDCVKIAVRDGNGLEFVMTIDIWVRKSLPVSPPELPALPPLPVPLPLPVPVPAPAPLSAAAADRLVREYVQEVLGTDGVKRLPAADGPGAAQVWAPAKLSRTSLLKAGRAPALAVLCPGGCTFKSDAELFTGSRRRARTSRRSVTHTVPAGSAQVVWLALEDRERRPLRRAARPRADFKVALRTAGTARRVVKRSVRIR